MAKARKQTSYVTIFIRLPDNRENRMLKAKVKAYANLNGMSLSEWLREAMVSYQTEQKKNAKFRRIVEER